MFVEHFLVEDVLAKASGSSTVEASDEVGELFDGIDLLFQELSFQEVGEVSVVVSAGKAVQIQQWLE